VPDQFDVVIVGARCAGASLAALLARQGVKVAVLERAGILNDTLSSHVFEADALAFLDQLGLADELRAVGSPVVNRAEVRIEDCWFRVPWPQAPGDVGGVMSVRRHVLDPLLAERACDAGADVRMRTTLVSLIEEGSRVRGVRARSGGREYELTARLVVGADGRHSTLASLCGARRYNVVANQRALFWGYHHRPDIGPEPTFLTHRWGERFVFAIPADAGLYQVMVSPELAEVKRCAGDREAVYRQQIGSCAPLAEAVAGAPRIGPLRGTTRWEGFFREAAGPGWVLLGDAGHFKDPASGRGIGDAFLQAGTLAPAIVGTLAGSDARLDQAMRRWGHWRDDEFSEDYWLANDFGRAGPVPVVLVEVVRQLSEEGQAGSFLDLLNHRARRSEVLTPARLARATSELVKREPARSSELLGQAVSLLATDVSHRWRNHRPLYRPARAAR